MVVCIGEEDLAHLSATTILHGAFDAEPVGPYWDHRRYTMIVTVLFLYIYLNGLECIAIINHGLVIYTVHKYIHTFFHTVHTYIQYISN